MTVKRFTISLPPDLADMVERAASQAGVSVSAWFAHASRRAVLAQGIAADLELLRQLGYVDDDGAEELAIARAEAEEARGGAAA